MLKCFAVGNIQSSTNVRMCAMQLVDNTVLIITQMSCSLCCVSAMRSAAANNYVNWSETRS
jgi:hypothetical protein